MTEQEKIIVSAYTGYLLCDFSKVHEYIEKKMGRPVWTHEMADKEIQDQIRDKCRADFLELAKSDTLLTDEEQRIFLKAIEREREYCKKVHDEWADETITVNLVKVCDEIERKVMGSMRGEE